jgi:hypothetical protein
MTMIARMILAGALTALVCGCGSSDVGTVSGTVTIGGQPLGEGTVVFENAPAGISVNTEIGPDGGYTVKTYEFDGLPPGTYQVAIRPASIGTGEAPLVSDPSQGGDVTESVIPEKYQSIKTSELSVTVVGGKNPSFDFDLSQ